MVGSASCSALMFTGEKNEPNDVWLSIMQALNNIMEHLCISLAMLPQFSLENYYYLTYNIY